MTHSFPTRRSSDLGIYALAHSLAAYAETPEKLDIALEVMMALPELPDVATIDCKTSFFFAIENKLRDWKLIAKYALASRVRSAERRVGKAGGGTCSSWWFT